MKFSLFLVATSIAISLVSCKSAPDADKAKTEAPTKVEVKPQADLGTFYKVSEDSKIGFIGTKPTGQHEGYFTLKAGEIAVKENNIQGGHFAVDINSLTITDVKDAEMNKKLAGHLLSPDFFDAAQFGIARFVLASAAPIQAGMPVKLAGATHTVTGNLSLKGKEQSITFPAIINITPEKLTAKADFNINRADFGMSYGTDKSLKDKFISPEVNIKFDIVANMDRIPTAETKH